jgi:hypothetical protein
MSSGSTGLEEQDHRFGLDLPAARRFAQSSRPIVDKFVGKTIDRVRRAAYNQDMRFSSRVTVAPRIPGHLGQQRERQRFEIVAGALQDRQRSSGYPSVEALCKPSSAQRRVGPAATTARWHPKAISFGKVLPDIRLNKPAEAEITNAT